MRDRVIARYVVRTVRWQPVLLGLTAGLVLLITARVRYGTWGSSPLLFAMVAIAAGVGLALDDTAGEILGAVPKPLWVRGLRGAMVSGAVAAASWALLLLLGKGIPGRVSMTVMAGALGAVALGLAAAARRRLGPAAGGLVAAPAVVGFAVAARTLTHIPALRLGDETSWALSASTPGMAWRWAAIAAVAVAVFGWNLRDPARIRR